MPTTYLANWVALQHRKQEITNAANKQETNITLLTNIMWETRYLYANKLTNWANYNAPHWDPL